MSPTSLNRPIVEKSCIYNLSYFFVCVWSMVAIFQTLSPSVTLKMGSRSPKPNQFLSLSQVWSKSIHSFLRQDAVKPFSNNLSLPVTLEMGSRSPKSNQFFFKSQQYSCASLITNHPFLHEIGCRQAIFQQSKPLCDLGLGNQNLISSFPCHHNIDVKV